MTKIDISIIAGIFILSLLAALRYGFTSFAIASDLGSIRPAFLSLPIELIAIAIWHNGESTNNWSIAGVIPAVLIYH